MAMATVPAIKLLRQHWCIKEVSNFGKGKVKYSPYEKAKLTGQNSSVQELNKATITTLHSFKVCECHPGYNYSNFIYLFFKQ